MTEGNSDNIDDDAKTKGLTLRVQKAKKRDIGRNIIRIDPKTMENLNIQTGDVIGLFGKLHGLVILKIMVWELFALIQD